MADAAIKRTFVDQGHVISTAIARMTEAKRGAGKVRTMRDFAEVLHYASLTSWSDGVELGLAIAVRDIASGRRLLDWIRREILEDDGQARENTEASVAAFMAVLDR